jgi:predicted MPP superfamily phosphohydrolase
MKTLHTYSIGDIHGRNDWMYFTHGSTQDFEMWKTAVENGAPADDELWREDFDNFTKYDKIIFVGDYVDSFDVSNVEMKKNLEDIIFFKKMLPHKVVLLLGNHDIQYIVPDQWCSGFRPEMKHDFYDIFYQNLSLFQMAYQAGNTLWTHAGVTEGWLKELYKEISLMRLFLEINFKVKSKLKDKFNIYTRYYQNKIDLETYIEPYIKNSGYRQFNRNLINLGININNVFSYLFDSS